MGGQPITNQVAKTILGKLGAVNVSKKGAAHPTFAIYHEGKVIARTGLRHSSDKDIPVPHIRRDLGISVPFALEMAACKHDKVAYLRQAGIISREGEESDEPSG
jgi:hypothetical protein